MMLDACLMVHGSWLKLMAHGQGRSGEMLMANGQRPAGPWGIQKRASMHQASYVILRDIT